MDFDEKVKKERHFIIPVIGALVLVVASVGYIVFKIMSNRAYDEKWKDYSECGLG